MQLMDELREFLVVTVTRTLSNLPPGPQLSVAQLVFHDTTVGNTYFVVRTVTTEKRNRTLERHEISGIECVFNAVESGPDGPEVVIDYEDKPGSRGAELLGRVYAFIADDDSEEENFATFRETVRSACLTLNERLPRDTPRFSDDFVVVATHYEGGDGLSEDLRDSIPETLKALLRERDALGPEGLESVPAKYLAGMDLDALKREADEEED